MNANSKKKNAILMVAYTYYQSDPRVIREAEAAASEGFSVDFLALRRNNDPAVEDIRGVRVHHLSQSKYRGKSHVRYLLSYFEFFARCFFKATFLCMKRRLDVVHVNNMPDFLVFSMIIPKLLGARVMLDIHDPMPNTFASKFKGGDKGFFFRILLWQELLSARFSDRVITVHDPVKYGVLVKHGLSPESIHVVANFPDTDLFLCRKSYQVDGMVRLAFHGTILERYGLRNLITALSKVHHRDKIRAKIIGEGDFSTEFRKLISDHALSDMVEFDNHSYPVHEIPGRLADCNVGVIPLEISSITNYALPLKLVEYIALGLPVVSVRSAAINHYFSEEDCLFYDWSDAESLAQILDRLASNPELMVLYHRRSVALREKFSWNTEKKKYAMLLHDLCGRTVTDALGKAAATS